MLRWSVLVAPLALQLACTAAVERYTAAAGVEASALLLLQALPMLSESGIVQSMSACEVTSAMQLNAYYSAVTQSLQLCALLCDVVKIKGRR
jgi:hypothetical protein